MLCSLETQERMFWLRLPMVSMFGIISLLELRVLFEYFLAKIWRLLRVGRDIFLQGGEHNFLPPGKMAIVFMLLALLLFEAAYYISYWSRYLSYCFIWKELRVLFLIRYLSFRKCRVGKKDEYNIKYNYGGKTDFWRRESSF